MAGSEKMAMPMALVHTVGAIIQVLVRSIFMVSSSRAALSSSAIFLIVFVVVHAFGNLTALVSGDAFNKYGHKLHSLGWLLSVVELYLFSGFAMHAGTGLWITYTDKKLQLGKFSWVQARLALSGIVMLVFVIVHVLQFRFGPWYTKTVEGVEMRDLWRLQKEVFARPSNVIFYEVCVLALCWHMFWGWQKVIRKPLGLGKYLPKSAVAPAETIGNAVAVVVTASFVIMPLYTYFLAGA